MPHEAILPSGRVGLAPELPSPPCVCRRRLAPRRSPDRRHSVQTPCLSETNDPSGNQIVSYVQTGPGLRTRWDGYDTGGLGTAIGGAVVDKLASQGGLTYDAGDGLLVGVNGGSNTISEFRAFGPFLGFRHVVPSGGTTPVSVAVRGDLIYVLNAGGAGRGAGLRRQQPHVPSPVALGPSDSTPGLTPPYLNTPGQIGFTPDGQQLVVTTKANGSDIDVFGIVGLRAEPVECSDRQRLGHPGTVRVHLRSLR